MSDRLARLLPRRIAAQLALVVGASAVLVQIVVAAGFLLLWPFGHEPFVHVDGIVRYLVALPDAETRRDRLAEIRRAVPEVDLTLAEAPPAGATPVGEGRGPFPMGPLIDDLRPWVPEIRVAAAGPGQAPHLAFALPGGGWLVFVPGAPPRPPPAPYTIPLVLFIAFAGGSSVVLAVWASHGLVRPLRDLAAAAREFDIEGEPRPLPETGPEEVRVASRAFDGMRRRIRDLVEDRTRMLAAMGHDLRTPITRLRLRGEFLADETAKQEILRDLASMSDMIEGALTYLREGRHAETPVLVDLAALVGTVCDGAVDLGHDVVWEGPAHLARRVRPQALTRALTNLVDNAVKYGERARVRLSEAVDRVVIEIEDDGPGIPEAGRREMLRPFVRGDAARNLDRGQGFGLGLAIASAAVEGQDGALLLLTAASGGLLVRIELYDRTDGGLRRAADGSRPT
jgi:signal transduction histidine kinase